MSLTRSFLSASMGGLPSLIRFSATRDGGRFLDGSSSTAKKVCLVLLGMLLMGSLGSIAQTAPAPAFTAATAMTNVANAIETGLRGISASGGGGVLEIGRSLFGFFIVANLVWMLLKSYVSGTGFFNGFIADLVPFAVMCGVVALFLDRDIAAVLEASMNVLASAILTEPVASVSSMIAQAGQQAFSAVANVWNVEMALRVSWNPATWVAAIPAVLYALVGTAGTVFLILIALAIYIANLVMSQVSIIIAMIFAPFFVPFLIFKPAAWLFEGWLRFFLGAAMMKIVGLLMLKITSSMMNSLVDLSRQAAAAKPGVLDALSIDIVMYSAMVLLAGIAAMLMAQVPSLATGLLSGSAGGAGFSNWSNLASKSPATRGLTGGMSLGGGGGGGSGGRLGQAGNALSRVTQAMPNALKPVSHLAGAGLSRAAGSGRASLDMKAARDGSLSSSGERSIGRDVSRMSAASASSYVNRLERANSRTAARESGGTFVGPPSPRYVVNKPASSTTPKK